MKLSFIHLGTILTMFSTGSYGNPKTHNLTLPADVSCIAKQNFIPRMLFADMYWSTLFPKCIYVLLCVLYFSCIFCFICNTCAFVICALRNYLHTYISRPHYYVNWRLRVSQALKTHHTVSYSISSSAICRPKWKDQDHRDKTKTKTKAMRVRPIPRPKVGNNKVQNQE